MNIITREMKANLKSLIIWSIGVLFMVGAGMGKYAGMGGSGETMNELMAEMPESLQAIMGTAGFDLSKAMGFYGLLYLYLIVMATIHSVMLGANIIAKEERDKTVEFLLVKPISRVKVISFKLVASLLNVLVFNLVTLASSIIIVGRYAEGEKVVGDIVLLMVGMFCLQIIFLVIGTAIAVVYKNAKKAGAVSTGILLITFLLAIIINLDQRLAALRYITPFKYFEAEPILNTSSLDPFYLGLSLIIVVVLTFTTYHYYKKKDLHL